MPKTKKKLSLIKIIYFISTTLLIAGLFYNRILPDWISNTIKVCLLLMLIIELKIHFRKWIMILLSVFMFITSGTLFYSQYSLNRLVNHVVTQTNIITFVVLVDSPINTLADMKDAKLGLPMQIDDKISLYINDYLTTEIKTFTMMDATDDLTNLDYLYTKTIDVMILDNSMRDGLIEQDPTFESKTKTILTIEKDSIKEVIIKDVDTSKDAFIILISGVDSRTPGAVQLTARSDVNILLVINPITHKVLTISIPRDTYTPLGCRTGKLDKLTHSGVYGVSCTVKTIENLMDIDINYYVRVNFTAFVNIVSVLGTIDVYSKYAFAAGDLPYKFNVGMNTMNADQALVFSRERHAFAESDVQRGLNQQEVIKGIINKIIDPSTLLKIEKLISVASKSIDTNLTSESVMNLVQNQIANNIPWEFESTALTGKGDLQPTYSMGSRLLYVMWPNLTVKAQLQEKIAQYMVVETSK
jgi:LCP family protein required for cell wall assembly